MSQGFTGLGTTASIPNTNLIIGGDFSKNPFQRGTSFAAIGSPAYFADRFGWGQSGTMVVTASQGTDAPTVSQAGIYTTNCATITVTTAQSSIGAGDFAAMSYIVEGYDFLAIAQQAFTLSFWVKATVTGTYCVSFRNSGTDRSYIAEYSISTTNTWQKITITLPASPSAGTWNYTNGKGLIINFMLACGTTWQTTAGSWQTGNFLGTSNQVNAVATTSNIFELQLVKLEVGYYATPYVFESYENVLLKCQRYYRKSYIQGTNPGTSVGSGCLTYAMSATAFGAGTDISTVTFSPMRATPTVTVYSQTGASGNIYNINAASNLAATATIQGDASYTLQISALATANNIYAWHYTADAEL